jgi:HD-GYP domain-containing protein (c-di-GMP phosphodiesterase class II)
VDEFILVRKTQVHNYIKTPLYLFNKENGYVLYKPEDRKIKDTKFSEDKYPDLYLNKNDIKRAKRELQAEFKKKLIDEVKQGNLSQVKRALCKIVSEAFYEPIGETIESLPETIDIVYDGYAKAAELLKNFSEIENAGYPLVEHSVNVMTLVLSFCIYIGIDEGEAKRLSLCALLHDIGVTKLPKDIVTYKGRLPERQYQEYQNHTFLGHDIIRNNQNSIDSSIAPGVLEHHERLDGSGYPRGIENISFEGRLIGLINSFDHLIHSQKIHRKKRNAFDALLLIKDEVLTKGLFDKSIYKKFCLSLSKKKLF